MKTVAVCASQSRAAVRTLANPARPAATLVALPTSGAFFSEKWGGLGRGRRRCKVAVRTGSSTLNWLLGDHLGSTSVVTDANGASPITTLYKGPLAQR